MRRTSFMILLVVLSVVFEEIGSFVDVVDTILSMIFMSVLRVKSVSV